MKLANKIKFEVFCAFVHSRVKGVEIDDNDETATEVIPDNELLLKMDEVGKRIISELETVATIDTINSKISSNQSVIISNMYHNNYNFLLKKLEKSIETDAKIVPSLIGISMLIAYFEKDENEGKLNVTLDELLWLIEQFETQSNNDKKVIFNMQKIATELVDSYFKRHKK